jgi:hypothetical protein
VGLRSREVDCDGFGNGVVEILDLGELCCMGSLIKDDLLGVSCLLVFESVIVVEHMLLVSFGWKITERRKA